MSKIFVIDSEKRPLNPIHPAQARQLLRNKKAAVFKRFPFTLILKEYVGDSTVLPLRLKIDPDESNRSLSTRRVDLYKEICQVLLEKRRRAKELSVSLYAEQKLIVLRSLALKLMEANTQAFTLDESSSRDKTFKQAKTLIQQKLATFPNQTLTPKDFITRDDQGVRELLSQREQEEIYEFAHKTFQEYLAAVAITKFNQQEKKELLQNVFADDKTLSWWRETIRFCAAQTDASDIIQAALNYATVPVLTLAYQCKQEAQQISSESVRQQLEKKFEEGLKSEKLDEFTLAAEVKLAYRLNQLNHDLTESNSETESSYAIDSSYITHAEYQLFLNETNSPTNSPTTVDNKRQVEQPITNLSFWNANRFCAWLSLRTRKELGEPGICYKAATQTEQQQHPCEKDKEYADKGGIRLRLIRFQVPTPTHN
ncbi:MAG: RRXRR domain-containing protein [Iphinoe sp. HA4291-MV1]|jgi:predicted NACHT family NTPase|nr:RRXRR domain-containing protein [Iphinoe sp. HA4291-MV1]